MQDRTRDSIAVIGMALRLPGRVSSSRELWELIRSAQSRIADCPADRFDIDACYSPDPDEPGTTYARKAGYVEEPFAFDHAFFGIPMAEALEMDPQQRWMLQLSWAALENAGLVPAQLRGARVGLFMAAGDVDYARRTVCGADPARITAYGKLGANRAVGVGRVAYTLGFHGPAVFVDSTCSASLTAVHLAAQALRAGDCDLAIAGGTNLILGPEETIGFARLRAMSRSEQCRTFDAAADGYMRGEGGAMVVLKRAADAFAQHDRIDAFVLGSSINNDGASNGLTAPNAVAQEAVIRQALANARVGADEVGYVETHGTGTPLGDPIELTALRNVYGAAPGRARPLLLGGIKPQIGHLETAAGVVGMIKAILVLRAATAPRQACFERPNPRFRWDGAMLEVPVAERPLPPESPYAGVSSFGISGANAHAILAAGPAPRPAAAGAARLRPLVLSAKTPAALRRLAASYLDCLAREDADFRGICFTASARREHWRHRLAVLAHDAAGARRSLAALAQSRLDDNAIQGSAEAPKRVVFLFPGQGAWAPGVGAQLYAGNGGFREEVERCLALLPAASGERVRCAILGRDAAPVGHDPGQLAHFVVLHALSALWRRAGIEPTAVIGHSLGEHVAAVVAGVMSLGDGLAMVAARGEAFATANPGGAMLAVQADEDWLRAQVGDIDGLYLGASNGPEQSVLSGTVEAVEAAAARLGGLRKLRRLSTYGTPGHTPLMAPVAQAFAAAAAKATLSRPTLRFVSTVTGAEADEPLADPAYWVEMIVKPVRFHAALRSVLDQDTLFIEVGPGATLANAVRSAGGQGARAVASLAEGPQDSREPESDAFVAACARAYCMGAGLRWRQLYAADLVPVELPGYPFEPTHIELPRPAPAVARTGEAGERFERIERAERAEPAARADAARAPDAGGLGDTARRQAEALRAVVEVARPALGEGEIATDAALTALGYDSLALMELRVRLKRRFGHVLPPGLLMSGASLETIAAHYAGGGIAEPANAQDAGDEAEPARPPATAAPGRLHAVPAPRAARAASVGDDPVVELRAGRGPLVAIVHPVGGEVACYLPLARAWPGDARILALRHPDVDAAEASYRTVQALAAWYIERFESAAGAPPEVLGGWSLGGALALEMAAQWRAKSGWAGRLFMIDSPVAGDDALALAKKLARSVSREVGARELDEVVASEAFAQFFAGHGLELFAARLGRQTAERLLRLHACNAIALGRYRPASVEAPIRYVLASRSRPGVSAAAMAQRLRRLTSGEVETIGIESDHFEIVAGPIAGAVAGYLGNAGRIAAPIDRVTERGEHNVADRIGHPRVRSGAAVEAHQ